MRLTHLPSMGSVTKIEFTEALGRLHDLLDRDLQVLLQFRGTFGAATMRGRLSRVQTLPPDHDAVNLLLDDRQSLMLDPIDTEVLLVDAARESLCRLEFHLPSGVVAVVEEAQTGLRASNQSDSNATRS